MKCFWLVGLVVVSLGIGAVAGGQTGVQTSVQTSGQTRIEREIDPEIAGVVLGVKAIDNHAHPVLPPPNDKSDRGFDALPVDEMEPETDTMAWRPDDPQLVDAWKALWGFRYAGTLPIDAAGMARLNAARAVVKAREGLKYDDWVLDKAGIGTMLANRVTMGPGVSEPRFRWVPYVDALLFPLNNKGLAAQTPDKALFFPLEAKVQQSYLQAAGMTTPPGTLQEYLTKVVTPTLERQKAGGAVAVKFEVAYLRGFDFAAPRMNQAARVYEVYAGGLVPDETDYKVLQDFLFRYIAMEAGRLGLAVHLHAMSGGGGYYGIDGGNPLRLEPLFNDKTLRKTNFVLLHGGWPFVRGAGALLQKPNVYLDLSQETLTFSPRTLSGWLREWLETFPEKVLFGTDGYPLSEAMGWEEATWIANKNGREAIALALTGMVEDGEVTRARAGAIATEVLRGNAAGLYGGKP